MTTVAIAYSYIFQARHTLLIYVCIILLNHMFMDFIFMKIGDLYLTDCIVKTFAYELCIHCSLLFQSLI